MRHDLFKGLITLVILFGNYGLLSSQIIDFTSEKPYKKVFVETDNFGASYLDTLEIAYARTAVDTLKFSILNDLAYFWHSRNLNKAMMYTKEGLEQAQDCNNLLWEGRFQITQAAILLRMEKLDSAEQVLQQASNKVLKTDLPFLNTQMGYIYERRGQLGRAADFALESLRIGEELGDIKAMALAFSDLSNLFWKQSRYEKGLEYGLKSIQLFEKRNINDLDYDFTLYVVGNNYLALKMYDEALRYYEYAITIGERYGFYNNLSDVYISLVDLYAYLNRFDEAAEAGQSAIKYAELLQNNFMQMRSYLSIGKLLNLQGKYTSAISSLRKCIETATEDFGDSYYLSIAYETLGKAYAGNHQYEEAYQAFAEYDKLKKSVFTAEADQRISLLQTEFDVAQKDGTIQLQETQISKQRTRQTLIIIIAALLLMLLLLAYKAIKNNVRKNKLLQQQNREKEFLLKEIHHRVKNNLEIVSSLLSLQSEIIDDPDVIEAMRKSQQRVQSMSMIHQKLYQGQSLAAIEMKDYFMNLGNYLISSYGAKEQISLCCDMETLELDVDIAIPIGLIVNELITNAMKYAFPGGQKGKIVITLKEVDSLLYLTVKDNGVGKSGNLRVEGTGFGTQLIELLTRQLDGKMKLMNAKGTKVFFEFQLNKAA
ncbi:sensor histidine kinase [Muriicola sp. Z0-33]|uniref:sensor histidine kinase n=1 Tax=Muriicola sp. Z0-33 TaxID=2816957 RepID=UPI0022372FF4|nr:histidine kinase dimerization/phosphoacceptor domain -containing protein [Muriicola sp. Z0-33]MCW5517007.1 tetratricopeptide repeat protein [Muriicola sp. Z0-33]